jgi:hypothetical protein
MADNLGYTEGTGAEVATDEIGGNHFQRVKVTLGADGVNDGDVSESNPMPVMAVGDLLEALQSMSFAIQSLTRTIGLAQVNPLTGSMFVDGSRVTQPISGTVNAQQTGTWNIANLATIGSQNANSFVPSFERNTADNLLNFITIT